MADDLTKPLGLDRPRKPLPRLPIIVIAGLGIAVLAAGAMYFRLAATGRTGTAVVARIDGVPAGDVTGSIPRAPTPRAAPAAAPSGPALTEVHAESGGIADAGSGEVVIHDPSKPAPVRLAAAPREDLVEKGRYGPLPRIGDDGTRPLEAYARPVGSTEGMIRIAIVIGGIGIDKEGTTASLDALPGEVTLALVPYGNDIGRGLAAARAGGHEVLLQVPLEPFDYPAVDPGPHTLTTKAGAAGNLDNLRWLMSRLTTYVGVVNYMGGRFTSDPEAMAPMLAEIGRRGLLYLDDGSSRANAGADTESKAPFLRADIVLDADTAPEAIRARLKQLAAIARERGYAIATGSAFPSTVAEVAAFAGDAANKGIVIVPISALAASGRT
jgi:polysaccharide deacetylase 2 family uncharacterized protein YibQ